MKIGIDGRAAKWYRGTGIGTYTYQLISSINTIDKNNDYLIFLPDDSSLKDLNDNFHIESVMANFTENFWDEVKVPNLLGKQNMDLYHVPQNGVGISTNISCKKTITLHDIIPLRMPETVSDKYLKIFNEELPKIINSCEGIITVSEFSKNDIIKEFNFPKDNIFVTPLAAEPIYTPISKSYCKKILNSRYQINDNFVLYIGGFSPRKNILGLIDAFSKIPYKDRKKTKLVIVGRKGISFDKYYKRAKYLGIENEVIFTGFIPLEDLPLFYNASEMLVYPSFYEGFGLPPLEAMACGTPVIVSNLTSLPEICKDSAILVNPYNIDDISNAINSVLNDNLLMLSMFNKSLIRSMDFSWIDTGKKTIEAYMKMISS